MLESSLKYIFGMIIHSFKRVQIYKYEKHLQEYDFKLQNISYTKAQLLATQPVIGHERYSNWRLTYFQQYCEIYLQYVSLIIHSAVIFRN